MKFSVQNGKLIYSAEFSSDLLQNAEVEDKSETVFAIVAKNETFFTDCRKKCNTFRIL